MVRDFHTALPQAAIYVYDNNSTDNTCQAALAGWEGVTIRYEYKQGKGNVIRRMFREVDAECYIMADGDDTYPADAAPAMAERVLYHNADMVVGDRLSSTYFTENKRPFHNLGNSIVRSLVNLLFKSDYKDIMTGYRAFSYFFAKSFPILSKGFEIETEMSIHAVDKNFQVENVVVEYRDRPEGSESKLSTVRDGVKVIRAIVRLTRDYRPMLFFGVIALVLMLLSVLFFVPVLAAFLRTGMVGRIPTLLVCGFVFLAGMLSAVAGILLETLRQKDKRDFEFQLQQIEVNRKIAAEKVHIL